MRVLYSFPDRLGAPGIGTTAYHQVHELSELGVDVTVVCGTLERPLQSGVRVLETLRFRGWRVPHRALGVAGAYAYHDARVARMLQRVEPRPDVVHTWPRAVLRTARAARARGVASLREAPNTYTPHAVRVVAAELRRTGLDRASAYAHGLDESALARERSEFEAVDAILTPSEHVRDTFIEGGVPAEKLSLHQYGYDPRRFTPAAAHRPRESGLQAAFIGTCEPRKGLHFALDAWLACGAATQGRFVVCGRFVPGYRELLEDGLAHPSVDVRGFTSEPGAVMRQSDVFVFPSIEEGSALVTYEARASGCVLAVSDATGARCTDGIDALVHHAGDVEGLTAHLRRLDEDRDLLQRLRAASLAGLDELTWAAAAKRLLATYRVRADEARARVA